MSEQVDIKKPKLKDYIKDLSNRLDRTQDDLVQVKKDNELLKQYNAELKAERDAHNEIESTGSSGIDYDDEDDWDLEDL